MSIRLTAEQRQCFESVAAFLIGYSDHEKYQSLITLALRTAKRDGLLDRRGWVVCSGPFAGSTDLIIRSDRADALTHLNDLGELWELTSKGQAK